MTRPDLTWPRALVGSCAVRDDDVKNQGPDVPHGFFEFAREAAGRNVKMMLSRVRGGVGGGESANRRRIPTRPQRGAG